MPRSCDEASDPYLKLPINPATHETLANELILDCCCRIHYLQEMLRCKSEADTINGKELIDNYAQHLMGEATESSARVLYDSSFSIVGQQLKSQVVPSRENLKPELYLASLASSSSV
jgi:hypothetical protein